ncbi:MAG: acyltransferase [Candidatus Sulfotelmatobacter sp.]|jgi:peptidoglycan/LPS O-acetylase OafA/YrhL
MTKDALFPTLESRLSEGKIPALDGVRAVAISLVVILHFHFHVLRDWDESFGHTGVTLFFVLSGFLITWLLIKEDDRTGEISLWNFYVRRLLRIFPGFYCFWAVYVGLAALAHKHIAWGNCIAALFYVNNYYWPLRGGGEGAMLLTWSLGVEEQFYVVWPAIFRRFRGRRDSVVHVLAALCLIVLLHRILLLYLWHAPRLYLYTAFDTRMDSLAMGCLLAISIRTGKAMRFVQLVCAHWSLSGVTFALFALSMAVPSLARDSPYWCVWGTSVESFLSATLIVQMVVLGDRLPWMWINWKWVRFIGTISYSLYLYNAIGPDLVDHSPLAHTLLRAPVSLVASILLACGSYYIVERPFLRLKSRYEVRSKARVPEDGNHAATVPPSS